MQTVSSYGVELRKQNIPLRQTLGIYRSAVCYLTEVYGKAWEELSVIPDAKRRFNVAEHLVHTTKKNSARFDFDLRFPKMPSYLRRSAIQHALGTVSSYETRMELWEKEGKRAGKPRLVYENHAMPVFYRGVMYREGEAGKDEAYLKLYDGHDWKWFPVRLLHTDMWSYVKKKYKLNVTNFPFFVIVNSLSLLGPFPSFSDIVPHIHLETNIHNDYEYGLYYRMFQYIQKLVYMHECS